MQRGALKPPSHCHTVCFCWGWNTNPPQRSGAPLGALSAHQDQEDGCVIGTFGWDAWHTATRKWPLGGNSAKSHFWEVSDLQSVMDWGLAVIRFGSLGWARWIHKRLWFWSGFNVCCRYKWLVFMDFPLALSHICILYIHVMCPVSHSNSLMNSFFLPSLIFFFTEKMRVSHTLVVLLSLQQHALTHFQMKADQIPWL